MGAKGSVEAAKLNADNWGHLEVCINLSLVIFQKLFFFRLISGLTPSQKQLHPVQLTSSTEIFWIVCWSVTFTL